jgi:hypothetical protein
MAVPDDRDRSAPAGATCVRHPERDAQFKCPHCGTNVCFLCWHPAIARCELCLQRDPTEAAPPIPWDDPERPVLQRYFGTLATALSPVRSAPAFARDDLGAARRFLLLTALPLALLSGIIPYTRTLLFEGNFSVRMVGAPSASDIVLDLLLAMGVQLASTSIELLCLLLPFASLVRAYARPGRHAAAMRAMYYRFWLMPGAAMLFYLVIWALPAPDTAALAAQTPPLGWVLVSFVRVLIPVLLFVAMGSTARLACGLGPFMSMLVVIVPVILWLLVEPLATMGIDQILPPSAHVP